MELREKVKAVRTHELVNLSQEAFAKEIGAGTSTIAKSENGLVPVSKDLVDKICSRYGIDKSYFNGKGRLEITTPSRPDTKNSNPWMDEAYALVKKEMEYWRAIAMKLSGAELGKAKTLVYSGYLAANTSKSRKGVN